MPNAIKFLQDSHRYITEDGCDLTSVSKFTETFVPYVDWKEIARKSAAKKTKEGIPTTQAEMLKKWEHKRVTSARVGTLLHSILENEEKDVITCPVIEGIKTSISINDIENGRTYTELMIYDFDHMICGQSDKVEIRDGKINIVDYKGLSLDTEIPTKNGFKMMRDIKVGDVIFDGNGNLTTVKHVSSIHYNPCYKLIFDTNDTILCDGEHKWVISERISKNKYIEIEARTDQLLGYSKPLRIKCSHLNIENIDLPLDPYVLGAWLGDGNSHYGRITNMNPLLWEEIERRGFKIGDDISSGGSGKAQDRTIFGIHKNLKELNLLGNKHLPLIYLRSSYEQRLDLLRGIMDTDGYYHRKRKRCVMNTTKEWQANMIIELVASLGWKATKMYTKGSGFGKINIPTIQVSFDTDGCSPFLTRNKDFKSRNSEKSKFRYIRKIEKIETIPTRCISVASNSHTYLAGRSYIKTHNTDAKIEFKAFSSKWVKPRKLLSPIAHLDDSRGNIYSIKMSLYMYMLWKANNGRFKPGKLILEHIHLKRDEEGIPILENDLPVIIGRETLILPYRKKEVVDMLKTLEK